MKTALVTGGSRGIGRAICLKLAQMGYHVLINYVSNEAAAQETLAAIGGQGELIRFDVGDPEAVRTAVEGWQAAHGGVHRGAGEQRRHPEGQSFNLDGRQ